MSIASNPLTFVIIILGLLLLLLLGAYLFSSRRATMSSREQVKREAPGWVAALTPAGDGEEIATPAAETIEGLAQERLNKYPELVSLHLDFGTASSGDLEIWVGSERYSSIDAIPDERVRQAISEAVEEFNRGTDKDQTT
jgi:Ca2+/Na+ antiporter